MATGCNRPLPGICFLIVLAGAGFAWAGERKQAQITCEPTSEALVYECIIALTGKKTRVPITDAEFTVSADMPSMPGAHNIEPVRATPNAAPGLYRARISLDMFGVWAVRLDFTRPDRDRVVQKLEFAGKAQNGGHQHHSPTNQDE